MFVDRRPLPVKAFKPIGADRRLVYSLPVIPGDSSVFDSISRAKAALPR